MSAKLLNFVRHMTLLLESKPDEGRIIEEGLSHVRELVSTNDWLPAPYAKPHAQFYQQYLLYADPLDRLSVVSFVWGPGQKTPVHDHLTWGLVGILRGRERATNYERSRDGTLRATGTGVLLPGQVTAVSPSIGDINDLPDQVSISIHTYGRNIGRLNRHAFDPATGAAKEFVSGYASDAVPNLWS